MSWEKKQFDDKERADISIRFIREYDITKDLWPPTTIFPPVVGAPFKPIRPDSPFVTVDPVTGEPDPDRMP
jgi:hypothetical protein